MNPQDNFQAGMIAGILMQRSAQQQEIIELQRKLIESQQQIIELNTKLEKSKPTEPDVDVRWHLISNGISSEDAANAKDLELALSFQQWIFDFCEKYVKPYVHVKVYGEVLNQMTRGLPSHLAELQTQQKLGSPPAKQAKISIVEIPKSPATPKSKPAAKKKRKSTKSATSAENKKQMVMQM